MKFQAPNPESQTNRKLKNSNTQITSNVAQSPNRQIVKSSNLQIILFLLLSTSLFAQNEANVWKIPVKCGLDFNTGDPLVIDGFDHGGFGNATISDSIGNFLFAAYSFSAYSKNGPLPNSDGLAYGGRSGTVIVKWPGKDRIYYIFSAGEPEEHPGFYYSLVDMKLLDGQG